MRRRAVCSAWSGAASPIGPRPCASASRKPDCCSRTTAAGTTSIWTSAQRTQVFAQWREAVRGGSGEPRRPVPRTRAAFGRGAARLLQPLDYPARAPAPIRHALFRGRGAGGADAFARQQRDRGPCLDPAGRSARAAPARGNATGVSDDQDAGEHCRFRQRCSADGVCAFTAQNAGHGPAQREQPRRHETAGARRLRLRRGRPARPRGQGYGLERNNSGHGGPSVRPGAAHHRPQSGIHDRPRHQHLSSGRRRGHRRDRPGSGHRCPHRGCARGRRRAHTLDPGHAYPPGPFACGRIAQSEDRRGTPGHAAPAVRAPGPELSPRPRACARRAPRHWPAACCA